MDLTFISVSFIFFYFPFILILVFIFIILDLDKECDVMSHMIVTQVTNCDICHRVVTYTTVTCHTIMSYREEYRKR